MAKSLKNFVVGVGMDITNFNKGKNDVISGMGQIRSSALQLGALAGAGVTLSKTVGYLSTAVNEFKQLNVEADRFERTMGGDAQLMQALGGLYEFEGGGLEQAESDYRAVESLQRLTPAEIGSKIAEAGIKGIDITPVLSAPTTEDAMMRLADVMEGLSRKDQTNLQQLVGLSDAGRLSMVGGSESFQDLINRQRELVTITDESIKASRQLNDATIRLSQNFTKMEQDLAAKLIPSFVTFTENLNSFLFEEPKETELDAKQILGVDNSFTDFLNRDVKEVAAEYFGIGVTPTMDNPETERIARDMLARQQSINNLTVAESNASPTFNVPSTNAIMRDMQQRQVQSINSSPIKNDINLTVEIDGKPIDSRIKAVTERQYSQANEAITTNTRG